MNLSLIQWVSRKALAMTHAVQKAKYCFYLYSLWSTIQGEPLNFMVDSCDRPAPEWDRAAVLPPPGKKLNQRWRKDRKGTSLAINREFCHLDFLTCHLSGALPITELNQPDWEPWESPCLLLVKNSSVVIKQEYLWLWHWTQANRVDDVSGWFVAEILHLGL